MSERGLELYRRGGGVRRVATWVLVAVPMAMAATVLLGLAAHPDSAALGAGPRLEPLHGHLAAVPPGATPLGPAPSSVVLPLTVTLQPRDVAALAAEAQAVSDSASPQYHRFLTPQQFAQRYGPTQGTIAQVTATLRSEGLTVGAPSATGLSLPVSGTVAQVQSALDTPIDRYRLSSGKIGYHNRAAPQVPAAVAPQIQGILGLDTLSPPQPTTSVPAANASGSGPRALGVTPEGAPGQPEPSGSTCTMSSNNSVSNAESYGALDAPQLAQAYSFDPLYSSSDYGAGTTVALVELGGAGYSSSDISTFANCYGITPGVGQVTEKSVLGGGSGSNVEAELDIETVLSLAPKANIEVYEGGTSASMYDVVNQIETDDAAKIVSISWTNGCEAYVPSAYQSSENTLFQAAATEGQSVFVAAGDQGSEGCNVNSVTEDQTGSHPVAQVADPSTGTLYVANQSSNSVSVDSEGSSGNPSSAVTPVATVSAGSGPDAVALDSTDGKVFVANGGSSSVTALATSTCNQSTTGGCTSTATINSGLSGPTALAVNGSTLYVANSNGTVAVYNASTDAYVTSVSLPVSSSPTSLAVDASNGAVYVGDAGAVSRVDYFNATICNASVTTGCSTIPATISLPQNPVSMVVDDAAGSLYVAEGGSGGGIAVVSLSTHSLATTIATSGPGIAGTGKAQSVALSPGGAQVLAVLDGLSFPGDVLATMLCLLIIVAVQVVVAFFGYNLVHVFERYAFPILTVIFLIACGVILSKAHPGAHHSTIPGAFLLTLGASFGYAVGWNPYASDYTRYFKPETSKVAIAWWSGLGLFLSCALLEIVGAAAATVISASDALGSNPTGAFTGLLPKALADLTLLAIALGAVSANVLNIYSGALSFTAIGIKLPLSLRRAIVALGFGTIGFFLAWSGLHNAGSDYENFLLIIAYWIAPWLAVYFCDVLLRRNPGETLLFATRRTNWAGPVAMLAGMGISIWLFSNQTKYVGLVPTHVPSVGDLTFEAGFVITAVVYLGWHLIAGTGRETTVSA